ncbi:glycosyltransferase N-terminal domain-containing protein [Defluviimonas aestuarii]|uniref:3-deoxy-D-manno-octulosonic acid transferase n=1 Tax=Albidovulum aestuarii TaxID=1130726 RepID=UPI00249C6515|nr:glycosyltransferase N-terminal domain-containing protein [Defluviimonas aestuarii]MDI3338737.1 glycosyltransferase N-terminal domain-containing protein [Defluviimonas aestuarii]
MFFYRLLARILLSAYALRLAISARWTAYAERMGRLAARDGAGPLLWLHAASNGELTSARTVIETLKARAPELRLLITTNSDTARALAQNWGHDAILAPVDMPGPVHRFLDTMRPAALIVVENELWPERLTACAARGIPVFVIGARMSAGSARNWGRVPGLARQVMQSIHFLSAQDAASEARFRALGLRSDRIGPVANLKSAAKAANAEAGLPFPRATTLLAASTHEGEEEVVLTAFAKAHAERPDLRLILAPRHPRRRDQVERLIAASGLSHATRSRGDAPTPVTVIYHADTMGEMDRWYAAAGMTLVGGSLVDHGGHTPFEPAAHGSAILHGPHTANSAPAYDALRQAGGSVEVKTAEDLTAAILSLTAPDRQADLAHRATGALAGLAADASLDPFYTDLARAIGLPDLAG